MVTRPPKHTHASEILVRETQLMLIRAGVDWCPPIEGMSKAEYIAQLEQELDELRGVATKRAA